MQREMRMAEVLPEKVDGVVMPSMDWAQPEKPYTTRRGLEKMTHEVCAYQTSSWRL